MPKKVVFFKKIENGDEFLAREPFPVLAAEDDLQFEVRDASVVIELIDSDLRASFTPEAPPLITAIDGEPSDVFTTNVAIHLLTELKEAHWAVSAKTIGPDPHTLDVDLQHIEPSCN